MSSETQGFVKNGPAARLSSVAELLEKDFRETVKKELQKFHANSKNEDDQNVIDSAITVLDIPLPPEQAHQQIEKRLFGLTRSDLVDSLLKEIAKASQNYQRLAEAEAKKSQSVQMSELDGGDLGADFFDDSESSKSTASAPASPKSPKVATLPRAEEKNLPKVVGKKLPKGEPPSILDTIVGAVREVLDADFEKAPEQPAPRAVEIVKKPKPASPTQARKGTGGSSSDEETSVSSTESLPGVGTKPKTTRRKAKLVELEDDKEARLEKQKRDADAKAQREREELKKAQEAKEAKEAEALRQAEEARRAKEEAEKQAEADRLAAEAIQRARDEATRLEEERQAEQERRVKQEALETYQRELKKKQEQEKQKQQAIQAQQEREPVVLEGPSTEFLAAQEKAKQEAEELALLNRQIFIKENEINTFRKDNQTANEESSRLLHTEIEQKKRSFLQGIESKIADSRLLISQNQKLAKDLTFQRMREFENEFLVDPSRRDEIAKQAVTQGLWDRVWFRLQPNLHKKDLRDMVSQQLDDAKAFKELSHALANRNSAQSKATIVEIAGRERPLAGLQSQKIDELFEGVKKLEDAYMGELYRRGRAVDAKLSELKELYDHKNRLQPAEESKATSSLTRH